MDASEYPQPLWERAVAALQSNGQPLTAQSIQAMMNTLAGDPDPASGSSVDDVIDRTMQTAPNPAKVEARPLTPAPITATGRFIGNDEHANSNLVWDAAELGMLDQAKGAMASSGPDDTAKTYMLGTSRGQGPAKLNSQDSMSRDAANGANSTSDTNNYAPGTQGMGGDAGVREGDSWKPKKGAVGTFIDDLFSGKTYEDENGIKRGVIGNALNNISMPDMSLPSGGDLAAVGGVGALLATLLRRGKPGAPGMQSTRTPSEIDAYKRMTDQGAQEARGNRMIEQRARGQAIDAMQADRAKGGAKRSGRGGGGTPRVGGRRKNPYEPDMTLM